MDKPVPRLTEWSLMSKDLHLYLRAVEESGGPLVVGQITASVWERFAAAQPGVDFTRIFPFIQGRNGGGRPAAYSPRS